MGKGEKKKPVVVDIVSPVGNPNCRVGQVAAAYAVLGDENPPSDSYVMRM